MLAVLASKSPAGMDGKKSVVLVMSVDVEVAGPGPCIEPRDGFLDSETSFSMRFISLMFKVFERKKTLVYISESAEDTHG